MAKKIRTVETIRVSGDFKKIINRIKAKAMSEGRTPPTNSRITKMISKKINEGGNFHDLFIKF